MKKRTLLITMPLAALAMNGAAYLIVSKMRGLRPPAPEATAAMSVVNSAPDAHPSLEAALARRATGLAALEAGEYDKALIHFTEAKALGGDKANVTDLLRVTEDLRNRARTAPSAPVVAAAAAPPALLAAPAPPPPAPISGGRGPTRTVRTVAPPPPREVNPPEPKAVESSPASGLLLVTSNPRGLLVHVDGSPADLTPMRTSVRPGLHRVALFDADRKLYETSVDINEGSAATVFKDLSSETAAARAAAAPAAPAEPSPKEEPSRLVSTVTPEGAPAAAKTAVAGTGSLDITSPGLYGMIWVNGRPYGFPPVTAKDLPAGPVKVEVRINGVEKRSNTVVVQPNTTLSVKVR